MNEEKLIETISRRLKSEFENHNSDYGISINEAISFFIKFIIFPINNPELSALDLTVLKNLEKYYIQPTTFDEQFTILKELSTSLDPILKKILFIIDNDKFNQLSDGRKGLKDYILALSKLIKDYRNRPEEILWDKNNIIASDAGKPYDLHRVYFARNKVHEAKEWTDTEIPIYIKSVVVTYIYAISEYYHELYAIINPIKDEFDFSEYLNNIQNEFKKINIRYIDIESEEDISLDFEDLATNIIESDWDIDFNEEQFEIEDDDTIEEIRPRRHGKIFDLHNQINQFIIRGNPGTGKTTTLRYLTYSDTLRNDYIPFYFALKDFDYHNSLIYQISKQYKIPLSALENVLEKKIGILYLDGLNEIIIPENLTKLKSDIINIINLDFKLIISTRKRAYENKNEFNIPVFDLQLLSQEQIANYVEKTFKGKLSSDEFINLLKRKKEFYNLCRNPFFLKMYSDVIIQTRKIPDNTGQLLRIFIKGKEENGKKIEGVFEREKFKPDKIQFSKNLPKYETLIQHLAYQTRLKKLVSFDKHLAIKILSNKANELMFNVDIFDFINDFKDLNLITENNEKLSFTHELYQEYFSAEELLILSQYNPDLINELSKDENWTEPLILLRGLSTNSFQIVTKINNFNTFIAAKSISSSIITLPKETNIVTKKAIKEAKQFKNTEISARGMQALLELNQTAAIIKIFKEVKKVNKRQIYVIQKMLENNNVETFINLINLFIKIENTGLILIVFQNYSGDFSTKEIKKLLIEVWNYLFNKRSYGILRILNEEFDIVSKISNYKNIPITEILNIIHIQSYSGIRFYISLMNRLNINIDNKIPQFINSLVLQNSIKSEKYALYLVNEYKLSLKPDEKIIKQIIEKIKLKGRHKIRLIIKSLNYYKEIYPNYSKRIFNEVIQIEYLTNGEKIKSIHDVTKLIKLIEENENLLQDKKENYIEAIKKSLIATPNNKTE